MATPKGDPTTEGDPTSEADISSKKDSTEVHALDAFFPETPTHKSYSDIVAISAILYRNGYLGWALCPKFYIIFRVLGLLHELNGILAHGVSDWWIPLHPGRLISACLIDAGKMGGFFEAQKLVLVTRQPSLDDWPYRGVICCDTQSQDLLAFVRRVHTDDRGSTDIVQDRQTGRVIMRRLVHKHSFHRPRTSFEDEVLIHVHHRHLLDYIGCFATKDSLSFLYGLAADLNLSDFLLGRQNDPESITLVQGWIGCLASAILYLHNSSVCHGNIKLTNIMIDRENIVLADFSQSISCTRSRCIGLTWDCTFVDVWDLGCVYVQMLSFICGQHPQSVRIPSSPPPELPQILDPSVHVDCLSIRESLRKLYTRAALPIGRDMFNVVESILTSTIATQSTADQVASEIRKIVVAEPKWKIFNPQGPFTDQEIELFGRELTFAHIFRWRLRPSEWLPNPRLYIIFHLMQRLDLIQAFIEAGVTDMWIPFHQQLLEEMLQDPSAVQGFLQHQKSVLSHHMEPRKHQHFLNGGDQLQRVNLLGRGGSGSVWHCKDPKSNRDVARKLIGRNHIGRDHQTKEISTMFKKELAVLRRITSEEYHHFVSMVGSYTDQHNFAILFAPVADTDLAKYLQSSLNPNKTNIRRWFGCLASAMNKLHGMKIKHKDVKPQNCLILGDEILLTDFGISRDWSFDSGPTTSGKPHLDPRYCAPEVGIWEKRNESADIWSLGCVYLEMYSVLKGKTVPNIRSHFKTHGNKLEAYYRNDLAISSWLDFLEVESTELKDLSSLIRNMLSFDRHERIQATELVRRLKDRCKFGGDLSTMFCDRCISEMSKPVSPEPMSTWEYWDRVYSERDVS